MLYQEPTFSTDIITNPAEPTNYMCSYTAEYRIIIAGILLKG